MKECGLSSKKLTLICEIIITEFINKINLNFTSLKADDEKKNLKSEISSADI